MSHRISYLFILILLSFKQGLCDPKYRGSFSTGCVGCKDANNDQFNADNMILAHKESDDEDGAGDMCIEGSLEVTVELGEGYMFSIDIEKETDSGTEPMFNVVMGICEALKDKDAPWTPVFAAMGIESCPIVEGTYKVKDMTVNLDFAKDILSHEYVGEYAVVVKMADQQKNVIACYNMGMSIDETGQDE